MPANSFNAGSRDATSLRSEGFQPPFGRADAIPGWLALLVGFGLVAYMVRPILALVQAPVPALTHYVAIGATATFMVVYFWAGPMTFVRAVTGRPGLAAAVLGSLAFLIAVNEREANWTILFVAAALVGGAILPVQRALAAIVLLAALDLLARVVVTGTPVGTIESTFAVIISGLVVLSFRRLDRTARELTVAKAEVVRLAAADERARIARDVHDLLGHSLSVIALKSELARRLVEGDPGRASAELQDIEGVARRSLTDIRETVAGYRRITLETELAGARVALSAAGIEVQVRHAGDINDVATESLLGWVVREGVTNVIRHSGSARCTIRIDALERDVRLEIADDGSGIDGRASTETGPPGSGLAGIRERLEAAGGQLEAGAIEGGGYRLRAVVPNRSGPRAVSSTVVTVEQVAARGAEERAHGSEPAEAEAGIAGGGRG